MELFKDDSEYRNFLWYTKRHLIKAEEDKIGEAFGTLFEKVDMLQYCLMPNHFHFLLRQRTMTGMEELMKKISVPYCLYFNKKYDRVGPIFQSTYKAVLIKDSAQLLTVSKYIHMNPSDICENPSEYPYSSYSEYLQPKDTTWLETSTISALFETPEDYKRFVESG